MKNCVFTLFWLIVTHLSYSQWDAKKYQDFWDKGDSLYDAKDYKNSALAYSSALVISAENISVWESWITARSWCLANYYDSAFISLNLSSPKSVTFSNLSDILTDKDLTPLYNDKRWQHFKDDMFIKAYNNFLLVQKETGAELINLQKNDTALAYALGNNVESAFSHLNNEAYQFLRKKRFDKAYKLFKVSIDNFAPNYMLYQNMVDYYIAIGDIGRAYIYFSRAEVVKYKNPDIISDTLLKLDSAINAEYRSLSKITGYDFLPPEYLITMVANAILKLGMADKAYTLFKLNMENYPNSFTVYKEMGNFYVSKGNKEKADECNTKSLLLQYELPANFFQPSFNVKEYIISRHDRLTKRPGSKVQATESIINSLGNHFLTKKMFDKAELLFNMNRENYPQSFNAYKSLANYYKTINDKINEERFNEQAQAIKSKFGIEGAFPGGPIADTTYDTHVAFPACDVNCPTILFDEVHNRGMLANGRYKPFVKLMANDGFKIILGKNSFTKQSLAETNVVVIVGGGMNNAESQILNDWVRQGGSLLAIIDHDGSGANEFLESLGVQTQEINVTQDSIHGLLRDEFFITPSYIVFSESDKLLGNHPIIKGRNHSEQIKRVQTFAGRTIIGPPGSSVLLKLSKSAVDFMTIDPSSRNSRVVVKTKGLRSHGVAFTFGKGKVVVISEAATLTAQLFGTGERGKIGMNTPGSDNKQFALNIMRWLTGYLK